MSMTAVIAETAEGAEAEVPEEVKTKDEQREAATAEARRGGDVVSRFQDDGLFFLAASHAAAAPLLRHADRIKSTI